MKKLKFLSLLMVIAIMLSSFAACGGCDHEWEDADCENPKTCEICGETEGEKGDHEWEDADCKKPKTCKVCGETEGEKADHEWEDGKCKICGKVDTTKVKVIEIGLTDEVYGIGVDKAQPELLEQVNEILAKAKADGTIYEIINNYFGDGTPVPVKSAELDESKDQLVVATNAMYAPFEYVEGDLYYGIDMEIAALLAKELGKALVIMDMKFESVCLSVGHHKCDIAIAALTINDDRKEFVNFSDPYYNASQKIIVRADDTAFDECKTLEDVEKILNSFDNTVKIGFQSGTTGQSYVEGDEVWGYSGLTVTPRGYVSGYPAVQDLVDGNISYVIIDTGPARILADKFNGVNR